MCGRRITKWCTRSGGGRRSGEINVETRHPVTTAVIRLRRPLNEFEITFDPPSHGWLPVKLRVGTERFDFAASDVLNDPVTELSNACVQLLSGSSQLTANWWLEPAWHTLKFDKTPNNSELEITFGYLADENARNPESEYRTTVNTVEFCRSVASALESLLESTGHEEYSSESGWAKPFPSDKMAILRSLITDANGG